MSISKERDTDADWNAVARDEPYWSVLSVDKYRSETMSDEAKKDFFESGDQLIGNILAFVRRHIDKEFQINRALDFGCGVGRLLIPLAKRSQEAVGVDIADEMLRLCRENISLAGIDNALTVPSDDELTAVEGNFNFVNSYIVLQHIPPERGYKLMAQLISKLQIGGVASLQFTYGKHRKFLVHETPRASFYRREGNMIFDMGPPMSTPKIGSITMFDYDLNQVVSMISKTTGSPVLMLPTNDDDHLGVHLIFKNVR